MARVTLGLDVGSTTAKVVALDAQCGVLWSAVERHRGQGRATGLRLLGQARARFPDAPLGCTGSLGIPLAQGLDAHVIHEVTAVVAAVRPLNPATRSIVELGGQDAKMVFLGDTSSTDDAQMNDRCAAGTGATLDRVARRLGLTAEDVAAAPAHTGLQVAARCGVFAETDVVNLVKQGATVRQAWGALAHAVVLQNLTVLARGRVLEPPVLLLGGPHVHVPALAQAWRLCLGQLWAQRGRAAGHVEVAVNGELYAAVGAAMEARQAGRSFMALGGMAPGTAPLGPLLQKPRPVGRKATAGWQGGHQRVHLGLDAGSTTAKVVVLDDAGALLASAYQPSCGNPLHDAVEVLRSVKAQASAAGVTPDVRSVGVTGYGRMLVAAAIQADVSVVETVAHAAGAQAVAPGVEVVVDVGGTDVKILRMEDGRVADFFLSNQCSAGQGAFLAACARDLDVDLEEFSAAAFGARRAPAFTVGCAVFMDTDRVTFQRDGFTTAEILAGLAWSIPRNVWEFVAPVPPARLGRRFLLTGGVQRNAAAAAAHQAYLQAHVAGAQVNVHPHPELCGAWGAALLAREQLAGRHSAFGGWDVLDALQMDASTGPDQRCTRCENHCARSIITLRRKAAPPVQLVTGNACERGAALDCSARRTTSHAPDLLAQEARRLFQRLLPDPDNVMPMRTPPVVGIPRVMALYRCAPLLLHYLRGAGVPWDHIILSPPTSAGLVGGGSHWNATDPCYPAKVVTAHVDWLLSPARAKAVDVLLLPAVTHAAVDPHGVVDTASCPIVAACGHTTVAAFQRHSGVLARRREDATPGHPYVLTPQLCMVDPPRLSRQLYEAWRDVLGLDGAAHQRALAHGLAAQRAFQRRTQRLGQDALAHARRNHRMAAVMLTRPYHSDPGIQHGISSELAARGVTVLSLSSLPRSDAALLDLSTVLPGCTNSGDAEKVWAARVIGQDPNLVAVELSSFRCGQDAAIQGVLSDLLDGKGKPVLRIHDLDEDRPSASLQVRVDTFVHAVHQCEDALHAAERMCAP